MKGLEPIQFDDYRIDDDDDYFPDSPIENTDTMMSYLNMLSTP
jgi:hypothetical protein